MSAQPKTEWFDDDSFWVDQYATMFSFDAPRLIAVARTFDR
ncbi:MAG TPA: hypothetical protein VL086_04255 [Candidatus Nitrosotalea sp.]|jgi:hypothetical protein|nr:hypothetical protein [Candidatus Nitrosotalea sp.]